MAILLPKGYDHWNREWDRRNVASLRAKGWKVLTIWECEIQKQGRLSKALINFRQARAIVNRQLQRERLHYPYRTATAYQDFIDRFGAELNGDNAKEVQVAAEAVLERIERLGEDMRDHPDVRRCRDANEYVVHRCQQLRSAH